MPQQFSSGGEHPVKSIILFSDGTGNSSAKLFKTNVWRLYEAVDLGPTASPEDQRVQIAYYDNGVGTSSFRPLAILGGVFGFGLKRNILSIYRYACRNYQWGKDQQPGPNDSQGDHIYGFGFSRGAFTMRLVASLIAKEGIVTYKDERDLARKSLDAYRAFCGEAHPRFMKYPAMAIRGARKLLVTGWRRLWGHDVYDPKTNYQPIIRFVGVWDTVAAYGGPFSELTRAIDNWIWPLSMPHYELSPRIRRACHALALDDERDAFHPLLWDEVHEKALIEDPANQEKKDGDQTKVTAERLKQVWFCGMHADVGGGYPDESLSYVSLLWMIGEARQSGLRLHQTLVDRIEDLSNSFGPIHNSRAGLAAYYRYQPRKIAAYFHPVDTTTLTLRDPSIRDDAGRQKGLVYRAKVHESVIARILSGTDSYAPLNLPAEFDVMPRLDRQGRNAAPLVVRQLRERIGVFEPGQPARPELLERARERHERQEELWNWVWGRRIVYFVTLSLTMALALMPLWIQRAPPAPFFTDGRSWVGSLISGLGAVLPGFLSPLIDTYSRNPFFFLLLLGLIVLFLLIGGYLELMLRDRIRRLWWSALDSDTAPLERGGWRWLRRFRDNIVYQWIWQALKWRVLPNVLGPIMLVLLLLGGASIYTQARLTALERGTELCQPTPEGQTRPLYKARTDFATRSLCSATGMDVEETARYSITFTVTEPWKDGENIETDPRGARANIRNWVGIPLRRVLTARYLQPLIEIRPPRQNQGVLPNVYIFPLDLTQDQRLPFVFRGEFTAARSGELLLFANDAVMPFELGRFRRDYFYTQSAGGGNLGRACVIIERIDLADDERLEADKVPPCTTTLSVPKRRGAAPGAATAPATAPARASTPAAAPARPRPGR